MAEETTVKTDSKKTPAARTGSLKVIESHAIKPGMTVKVHQMITEKNAKGEEKKRVQIFEGIVLSRKHGNEISATFTVRKIASGVGVEKIFSINSPFISKIELVKTAKIRRAKLGYLRTYTKKLREAK